MAWKYTVKVEGPPSDLCLIFLFYPCLLLLFFSILHRFLNFFFMDSETLTRLVCSDKIVGDRVDYSGRQRSKPRLISMTRIGNGTPPAIYEVVTTDPNVKGRSPTHRSQQNFRAAPLISVPGFVEQGSMIKVTPEKGEYMERMK
jgi:elongation factor P